MNKSNSKKQEKPALTLIQQIESGMISPKRLAKEDRQQCIESLILVKGYSVPEIAQIMKRSEKTIRRDIAVIRERNSLTPGIELAKQLVGEMVMKAQTHWMYLMQLARAEEGSVGEKSQAEYFAWKVTKELVDKLQTLGYLPLRPQEVVGDIFHHMQPQESEESFEEIEKTVTEIIDVAKETGNFTPELEKDIKTLNLKIEKAQIGYQVHKLLEEQKTNEGKGERQNSE